MRSRKRSIRACVGAALLCVAGLASAQGSRDPAAADRMFREGQEAAQRGDYVAACGKFEESQRLDPASGTLLNLADCYEHTGRLGQALETWQAALRVLPGGDDRVAPARQRASALERRVPKLTIVLEPGAPPGSRVRLDERLLEPEALGAARPVDAGAHVVEVTAPGRPPVRRTVSLREGDRKELTVGPGPDGGAAPPTEPTPAPRVDSGSGDGRRTLGFVIGGIGVLGIGAAAVIGIMALQKQSTVDDECDEARRRCSAEGIDAVDAGRTLVVINAISWGVGIAGLGAGTLLIATSGSSGKPAEGAFVSYQGRF